MSKWGQLLLAVLAASPAAFQATPASAIVTTYVSPTGGGSACSYAAPCATFAAALGATDPGGTIVCLEPGSYGYLNIFKSLTVSCHSDSAGSVYNGATIDGAGIQVVLRGLSTQGASDEDPGYHGLRIMRAASVVLEDCIFRDAKDANPNGVGIVVENASGSLDLSIKNTIVTGARGPGLQIKPTGTGSVKATVSNSSFTDNNVGIRADTTMTSGRVDVTVVDSVLDANTYQGLVLEGGSGQVAVLASRVTASNNGTQGMRSVNGTASLRISDSDISANAMAIEAVNGGVIQSFGNNRLIGNTNSSVLPPVITQR